MIIEVPSQDGGTTSIELTTPIKCLEVIASWLAASAPEPWKKIRIRFSIEEIDDVCEYSIVYIPAKPAFAKKRQFFIYDTNFNDCFFTLARLSSSRDKGYFKTLVFVLKGDGRFRTRFYY